MSTLYRKYRPQTFADVIGQEHIVQTLKNEIANGKVAHAYLFSGPRGVGKTTTARILAKSINCTNRKEGEFEMDNTCQSCLEITSGKSIDVIEIDAASHTGVDNVRENIIENAQFKPTKLKYKVFIIDEVHMLSTSAFNALLKTLEEPPEYIVFILATTELHKLPATIISRCQRFNFQKIGYQNMLGRLKNLIKQENIEIEESVLGRIISKSDGCLRDAESLLGQVLSIGKKQITEADTDLILPATNIDSVLEYIKALKDGTAKNALDLINNLNNDGVNFNQFSLELIETLRAIMVAQNNAGKELWFEYSEYAQKEMTKLAKEIPPEKLILMIERALEKKQAIKFSPLSQLPLEILAVEFSLNDSYITKQKPQESNEEPMLVKKIEKKNIETIEEIKTDTPTTATTIEIKAQTKEEKLSEHPNTIDKVKNVISKFTQNYEIKTSKEEFEEKWTEIKKKFAGNYHTIGIILESAKIKDINNKGLILGVPFSLHKDKIMEKQAKNYLETIIEETFGERIPVSCELEEAPLSEEDAVDNIAMQFGGELI